MLGLAGLSAGCGAVAGSNTPVMEPKSSVVPLAIAYTALAEADAGVPYSISLSASGGVKPYSWDIATGTLPPGLQLGASSGVISGVTDFAGSYLFTAQVTDSNGERATVDLTLTVSTALTIVESSIPAADAEMPYAASLSAAGGIAPYQWSLAAGSLPPGVQLQVSTGTLSGQTALPGSYPFAAKVTDSGGQSATKQFTLMVSATLAIVNSALSPGEAGTPYAATLAATGGMPPYYWSIVGGSLPSGLLLQASSGSISGVIAAAGSYSFTARVNDSYGQIATLAFNLTVSRSSSPPIVLNGQSGIVIEGVHISSQSGDCVQLINSSNITISNSDIGPCAGNAISISGGDQISVFDSYIHPETQSAACCDHNNGILAVGTSNLSIQGNVIAYGETNIEVRGSNTVAVTGNFLLNPRDEQGGIGPRGSNFQCWSQARTGPSCTNVTVENNYALSSLDTAKYLYPEATADSINFGHTNGMIARNNYITGGHSGFGCGLIADLGANDAQFLSNTLIDTGQCGIGIADGTNQLVDGNRVINRNPVDGSGNQAIYVWQGYGTDGVCGPVTVSNNIAIQFKPGGIVAGFWKGAGCDPLTLTGNVFGQPALDLLTNDLLTPVEQALPPPLIPPQPRNCVARSPYSTQTAMAACNP